MMKKLLIISLVSFLFLSVSAQEEVKKWTKGGDFSVNFTQVSLTNWAAGGQNSVSGVAYFKYEANYKNENVTWDNLLDLGYGLSKQEDVPVKKNEDKLIFQSKLGIAAGAKWYYSGLFSFKSQFADGFADVNNTELISAGFAPAYINIALGMDFKPSDNFALLISPLSGKITMVTNDVLSRKGAFGVEPGETSRMEFGGTLNMKWKQPIAKNVTFNTDLTLFSNYLDNPDKIDVDWKAGIDMKINDYLSAKINTNLLYDYDIVLDGNDKALIQFKELLAIGFNVKF